MAKDGSWEKDKRGWFVEHKPYNFSWKMHLMYWWTISVQQERMAGAKLIASLMASEDVILENISVGLLEARSVLSTVSSSDPSHELQQLCRKLLACISSPWATTFLLIL